MRAPGPVAGAALLVTLALASSCSPAHPGGDEAGAVQANPPGGGRQAALEGVPSGRAAIEIPDGPAPPALAAVPGDTVEARTGPGGKPFEVAVRDPGRAGHDRRIGRRTFHISLREGRGVDYPCASCHRPGEPAASPERIEDAHRNVLPRHPDPAGSPCATCHDAARVDRLVLTGGEAVPLTESYRLCAQCHYRQADAWAAGAHGKRLDGWRGRRVLMGCADCHDPHGPAITARIPFPGPRDPRAERSTP